MEPTLQVQGLNPQETAAPANPTPPPVAPATPSADQTPTSPSLPEKPKRNLKSLVFILIGVGILGAGAYFIFRAPSEELTGKFSADRIAQMPKADKGEPEAAPEQPKPAPAPAPAPAPPAPGAQKGPSIDLPEVNLDAVRELPPQATPALPNQPSPPPPAGGDEMEVGAAEVIDVVNKAGGADRLLAAIDGAKEEAPAREVEIPKGEPRFDLDMAADLAKPDFGGAVDVLNDGDRQKGQRMPEPIRQPEQPREKEKGQPLDERQFLEVQRDETPQKKEGAPRDLPKMDPGSIERLKDKETKLITEEEAAEKQKQAVAEAAARVKAEQDAKSKAEAEAFKKMIEEQEAAKKSDEEKKKALAEEEARKKAEAALKAKAEADAKKKAAEEKRKQEEAELLAAILAEEDEEESAMPPATRSGGASDDSMEQQLNELKKQLAAAFREQSAENAYQIAALQAEIIALNKQIAAARDPNITIVVPQAGGTAGTACADPTFTYDPVRKVCIPETAVTVIPEKEKAKEISIVTKKDKKIAALDTAASGTEGETEASAVAAAAAKAKAAAAAKSGAPSAAAKASGAKAAGVKNAGVSSGTAAAASAKKLHGAAIQGETGPGILLYPLLVASANGLYYAFRKRRKSLK